MSKSKDRTVLLAVDRQRSALRHLFPQAVKGVAYTPFGYSPIGNEVSCIGFGGQIRETSTGWYLLGNGVRAYNPVLMQFNSPDSLSPFGKGGIHAYRYCGGDPVNRTDPSGHMWRYSINRNGTLERPLDATPMETVFADFFDARLPPPDYSPYPDTKGPPPAYAPRRLSTDDLANPPASPLPLARLMDTVPRYTEAPLFNNQVLEYRDFAYVEVTSFLHHRKMTAQLTSPTSARWQVEQARHELNLMNSSGRPLQTDNGISLAVDSASIRDSFDEIEITRL